jgi:hypothetical protein
VRRGTWAANLTLRSQLGRRAGMAPIAGLCRGQGKGSTVRLRGPNTACTVRQGNGKGKGELDLPGRPASASQPSQLRLGAINGSIPVRFPLAGGQAEGRCPIRQGGRGPLAMPLSAPHLASPEQSRSGPTVPGASALGTSNRFYGMPDVPTHSPGDVRRWGWHRVLRVHISGVLGCVCFVVLSRGSQLACLYCGPRASGGLLTDQQATIR